MTEPDNDLNESRLTPDPGRARKRKLRRDTSHDGSPQVEISTNRRRAERRSSSRNSSSIRERLVESQIKVKSDAMDTIKGKLFSASRQGGRQPANDKGERKPSVFSTVATTGSTRRKAESRRSESLYEATPRAETQRISGTEHGSMPRKSRRVYDARSESDPPVMVRGGMRGMAFGRVATSRLGKQRVPRRRIDVPLKVTGAEVRLPSVPFVHLGWRGISLFMVLMMCASLILMWKAPTFQVSSVEAEGLQRLTVSDLNAVAGTFGKSIFTINPKQVDQALRQAYPEFSKVSVRINLPASVKVVVTERQPVIAWEQDGKETWVDEQGVSFPPRGVPESELVKVEGYGTPPTTEDVATQSEAVSLPPWTPGAIPENTPKLRLSTDLIQSILALGAKMPESTILVYDSERGLGWNDPNGWEVFFGAEDQDTAMKLKVYQTLVEQLQSEGIKPALISVEYVHAPYYRMER